MQSNLFQEPVEFSLRVRDLRPRNHKAKASDFISSVCCTACYNAEEDKCICKCGGAYHGMGKNKNHSLEKYIKESIDEVMQNVEDYAQAIKEWSCRWCGADLSKEPIMGYPHEGGWTVYGKKEKYWLYIVCPHCGYQWNLQKLGVSRN